MRDPDRQLLAWAIAVLLLVPRLGLGHELPDDVPVPPGCNPDRIEKRDYDFVETSIPRHDGQPGLLNETVMGPRVTCNFRCPGPLPFAGWAELLKAKGWTIDRLSTQFVYAHNGESRFLKSTGGLSVVSRGEPRVVRLPRPAATPEALAANADLPWLPPLPPPVMTPVTRELITTQRGPIELINADGTFLHPPYVVNHYAEVDTFGAVELIESYVRALRAAGWQVLRTGRGGATVAHYARDGRDLWVKLVAVENHVEIDGGDVGAQEATARLAEQLEAQGHVALYGIYFDTGSATLKPESEVVLRQVKALLDRAPTMKLEVQGHTDNVGKRPDNEVLSDGRARAVVGWLSAHGVAAARLTPRGYADTRPVADNHTPDGRAKNRRVELAAPR